MPRKKSNTTEDEEPEIESKATSKEKKSSEKKEKKVKEKKVKEEKVEEKKEKKVKEKKVEEKKEKKVKEKKVREKKSSEKLDIEVNDKKLPKCTNINQEIIIDSPNAKNEKKNDNETILEKIELNENVNEDYNKKFNKLKESYVKICKETSEIQLKLNEKDKERENILKKIRQIQIDYLPSTNFGVILGSELITDENKKNLVKKSNNLNIKKPIKKSDMETDDSNSEYSDDMPFSDGESD